MTPSPCNSPLRWVGGKSRLRKHIIPLFPKHHTYAEPFGGGGSVLLGKTRSEQEIYGDLDPELTNFFTVLRDQPQQFMDAFNWELVSRQRFNELSRTDPETLSPTARAHRLFYLIQAGWGGELGYPRMQTSIHDKGGGNRLIGALKNLEKRIMPVHARLQGVTIKQGPAERLLGEYGGKDTFFYLDPPYPGNGVNYRLNMRELEPHQALAEQLRTLNGPWMLSSYDRPEIRELYGPHWHYIPIQNHSGMSAAGGQGRTLNQEVLILNYDPYTRDNPT